MKIAILGAGNVGGVLGRRLGECGHAVCWGVANLADAKYEGMDVRTVPAAVEDAEVILVAVPWGAAEQVIKSCGDLSGKIVIDATNPIAKDFSGLVDVNGKSAAEAIAVWAPGAYVVKAFNTIGYNVMQNPVFDQHHATLLVASDHEVARDAAITLAKQLGFDPIDAGPLSMAKYLEAFAWVWIALATKQGHGRDIVFQLLRH